MGLDLHKYFAEEKIIKIYLNRIGKSEAEKRTILNECWNDQATQQNHLRHARGIHKTTEIRKATPANPVRASNVLNKRTRDL